MTPPVRNVTIAALLAVLALLAAQVSGIGGLDPSIDVTTLALLLLALVLGFAIVAPGPVTGGLERITTFKLPGLVEIGLQAANRAERIQAQLPPAVDEVETLPRPRGGGPQQEYEAVRETLQERLRFSRVSLLDLPPTQDYEQIVQSIEERRLLEEDELHLVRDVLGNLEEEVGKLPPRLQEEYLDTSWRFAVRFGTLVFERLVRRRMTDAGWFIIDFDQARSHRPDFLAFRGGVWLLIAARLPLAEGDGTRQRLAALESPFEAKAVVVCPDSEPPVAATDGDPAGVAVIPLADALRYRG